MNSFGLLIQGTTAGFNDLYISENLREIRNSIEIDNTAKDERKFATKLANQSDVYIVQLTQNYRVYSLIVTNITDFVGGAGFYAIRIYTPKKFPLANFDELLEKINTKYQEYQNNDTPKNNQDYNSFLKFNLPLEVSQQDFINVKSNEDAYYYFDPSNPQLRSIFNHKSVALFNKVYAFNKDNAVPSNIANSLGLKSFEESKNSIKEVTINNSDRILKELKINNSSIDFNSSATELTLIVRNDDQIVYNTKDNSTFKQADRSFIEIKYTPPTPPRSRSKNKPGFINEYGIYLLMIVMMGVLLFGSWYFVLRDNSTNIDDIENIPSNNEAVIIKEQSVNDISKIIFKRDESKKDSSVFKTTYPKLDKYSFKFDNNKWFYRNTKGQNIDKVFFQETLNEIDKFDTLNLDENKKMEFFKSLKEISGQEIIFKEAMDSKKVESNVSKVEKKSNQTETIIKKVSTPSIIKTTPKKTETPEEIAKRKRIEAIND